MNYSEIARRLVDWHTRHQRSLPWRTIPAGDRDAYAVWISEIMAQQTRLDTVVDYYHRWMARFPTIEALAAADAKEKAATTEEERRVASAEKSKATDRRKSIGDRRKETQKKIETISISDDCATNPLCNILNRNC